MLHVAVIVPPISNVNTPYSAAPRLTAWLRQLGHQVTPLDLNLEIFLRVYSKKGLERMFAAVDPDEVVGEHQDVWCQRERYLRIIDEIIPFLQGRDPSLAHRIVRRDYIPEGPRFRLEHPDYRRDRYGEWGKVDHARELASLMMEDLAALFGRTVSENFELLSYAEEVGEYASSFDKVHKELIRPMNPVEEMIEEACAELMPADVDLVCLTCPFPGMLLSSLIIGRWLGRERPRAARALGGGYPSTELRSLTEPRLFDYLDYMAIDDGEVPLQQLCARLEGKKDVPLYKTFTREHGQVVFHAGESCASPRFRELPTPDYAGFDMRRYLHLIPYGANLVGRLVNEGPWLKLTAAHGCYWKKCTFCDIHLPYIEDFDPLSGVELADQMDAVHQQTGLSSYHFTDEAAPPPLMVNLALELLRRDRAYQFWGNIRFDTGFTADRCRLLAAAGMIAVTGGIEIASDEVLPKIDKGITVPQVIRVLSNFAGAGILAHAYMIYGFPGESVQDTVNSLEIMRQLMGAKLLHSGFYHKFGVTKQSPVGRNPELFGIKLKKMPFGGFADYNRFHEFLPGTPVTDDRCLKAAKTAIHLLALGSGLEADVRSWFSFPVPEPTISRTLVADTLREPAGPGKDGARMCWLGGVPRWSRGVLSVTCANGDIFTGPTSRETADNLARCHPSSWTSPRAPSPSDFDGLAWAQQFSRAGLVTV